jgi:hypothetical protein
VSQVLIFGARLGFEPPAKRVLRGLSESCLDSRYHPVRPDPRSRRTAAHTRRRILLVQNKQAGLQLECSSECYRTDFRHAGFLQHVVRGKNYATGQTGTPTDFLAFHAKGRPEFVDGHVRMGIATHLREIDRGFGMIAAVPELKSKPIVIGESDLEGRVSRAAEWLSQRHDVFELYRRELRAKT